MCVGVVKGFVLNSLWRYCLGAGLCPGILEILVFASLAPINVVFRKYDFNSENIGITSHRDTLYCLRAKGFVVVQLHIFWVCFIQTMIHKTHFQGAPFVSSKCCLLYLFCIEMGLHVGLLRTLHSVFYRYKQLNSFLRFYFYKLLICYIIQKWLQWGSGCYGQRRPLSKRSAWVAHSPSSHKKLCK